MKLYFVKLTDEHEQYIAMIVAKGASQALGKLSHAQRHQACRPDAVVAIELCCLGDVCELIPIATLQDALQGLVGTNP